MGKLKISFQLKSTNSKKSSIAMLINFGYKEYDVIKKKHIYKPLKYYTGITLEKSNWNYEQQQPKNKTTLAELISMEEMVKKVFQYLQLENKTITPELLKEHLDVKLKNKQELNSRIRLTDYIEHTILKNELGTREKSTLSDYKGLKTKLEDFETKINKSIYASDINEQLYLSFKNYLQTKLNRINSVWKVLKTLKSTLNEIERKHKIKVFKPSTELSARDKVPQVTEEKVFFDFHHIEQIIAFYPKTEKFRNVKGILLTLLFTGCRYSDVFKIKPEFAYSKDGLNFKYARYISTKSNIDIISPILKPLANFYIENKGLPYKISDVKFNAYVKDLIEDVGIKDNVTLSFTDSFGTKQYESKPFHKFVTSHIGRRSFITNFINYIPVTILSKISGHKLTDKNVIFAYNKISLEENAVLFIKEIIRQSETGVFKIPLV